MSRVENALTASKEKQGWDKKEVVVGEGG